MGADGCGELAGAKVIDCERAPPAAAHAVNVCLNTHQGSVFLGSGNSSRISKGVVMPEKRLVVRKRDDLWEVRAPSAHYPDSTHSTWAEAEKAAEDYLNEHFGGGYISIIL